MHKKDEIMPKYAKLIYNGYWYSKARFKLQKIVDQKRNKVNGSVKLKLYKGNIIIVSRQTKSNAYSMKKVSFEENKTFNKSNVERFINFHKKKTSLKLTSLPYLRIQICIWTIAGLQAFFYHVGTVVRIHPTITKFNTHIITYPLGGKNS